MEVGMVKPQSVLDRSRRRAHGISTPTASPPKLITALRYSAPSHVQTASVTRRLTANHTCVLKELNGYIEVQKEVH
jgi:hypothetical protein